MILVTTGTNAPAFDRLLQKIDSMRLDEELFVQHGPSAVRPAGAECIDYVSYERFVELVRQARVVVTHAGVGSILTSLMNGKRPVVVPRLARFGEHVDDHQLELTRRLSEIGVVVPVEDLDELDLFLLVDTPRQTELTATVSPVQLSHDLGEYLRAVVGVR